MYHLRSTIGSRLQAKVSVQGDSDYEPTWICNGSTTGSFLWHFRLDCLVNLEWEGPLTPADDVFFITAGGNGDRGRSWLRHNHGETAPESQQSMFLRTWVFLLGEISEKFQLNMCIVRTFFPPRDGSVGKRCCHQTWWPEFRSQNASPKCTDF